MTDYRTPEEETEGSDMAAAAQAEAVAKALGKT